MNMLHKAGLAIVTLGAVVTISAETRPVVSPGQRIVASAQNFHLAQVEYCMRNFPELREQLSLAYATYSNALPQAIEILNRRFPSSKVMDQIHIAAPNDERAKTAILENIHSVGFSQCGAGLVQYLHNVTGESLAKTYGDGYAVLYRDAAEKTR